MVLDIIKNSFLYIAFFLFTGCLSFVCTQFIGAPEDFSRTFFYSRVLLVVITLLLTVKLIHKVITSSFSEKAKNYLIIILSLVLLFWGGDLGFMFVARSFGASYPLADQNWMRRYWKPLNSYGYRAMPINFEEAKRKKNILIVGSSYTAGDGINHIKDRYSNRLQKMLSDSYLVHNLGLCGSEAIDAFKRLNEYPAKPDILVFAHTTKSIKGVNGKNAHNSIKNYRIDQELNTLIRFVIKNSYLANYLFWKFYAPAKLQEIYLNDLENNPVFLYLQREKISAHLNNLQKFINYSEDNNIPLIVISFTAMNNSIAFSNVIVANPIERYFAQKNIPVVSVYDLVKDIPYTERTINSSDAHPGIIVHHLIAEKLFETLEENHLIN